MTLICLSVVFMKCKPINPTTTKTAPATINQCAYCIAEPPSRSSFLHLQPDLDQAADGFGNGRCRSRTLTVSQLSRQAKENPVRGAGFERGKFSGAHRDPALMRERRAEGYFHRLPLIVCPEPDSESP